MNISKVKKALILGKGTSGEAAAKFLRSKVPLIEIDFYEDSKEGIHHSLNLQPYDLAVASPGIDPKKNTMVGQWLEKKGRASLISEIDLAMEYATQHKIKTVVVTGTNGKSTLVHLIDHGLSKLGYSTFLGGNFGVAPSTFLSQKDPETNQVFILELSSYQLEWSAFRWRADVALFSNFSADHLARHVTLDKYFEAKWSIGKLLTQDSPFLVTESISLKAKSLGLLTGLHTTLITPDIFSLKHPFFSLNHNALNLSFAVKAMMLLTGNVFLQAEVENIFSDYRSLPHRCELLGYIKGMPVINDSKSTNVASTLAALESFKDFPIILFLGGAGKGESYLPISDFYTCIKRVFVYGASREDIERDLPHLNKTSHKDLADALESFLKEQDFQTEPSVILFSPACASFDSFKNFEERGEFFRKKVQTFPTFESSVSK